MRVLFVLLLAAGLVFPQGVAEEAKFGEARYTQDEIASGAIPLREIQLEGLRVFSTPFNALDGYGDGPSDPADPRAPGGRPTLQGNGTFLRVNGLDGQTCLECHAIVSAATVPATLGVGGVGGSVSNAMVKPATVDVADSDRDGDAGFDGRFANPPFLYGSGGVELLAAEMTADLQALRAQAIGDPGVPVELTTHGVSFGTLSADGGGVLDTSAVEGIDDDLVVRPFGRKGDFATVRAFDLDAMQFHFGMQPVEVVGAGSDPDGDGVIDEISPGAVSALHVFETTLERPWMERLSPDAEAGLAKFTEVGCADCHVPDLQTRSTELSYRFPEVETDPAANVFLTVNLAKKPASFRRNGEGGITVPLFSDLKRHEMGDALVESFSLATPERNREFITARLWGIADTSPYLHDGRATTLHAAILLHGGEAQDARDAYDALSPDDQALLISFLRSLHTPKGPAHRLVKKALRRF